MGAFRDAVRAEWQRGTSGSKSSDESVESDTPPESGIRWEYRVLNTGFARDTQASKLEGTLNKLGKEGWELVAVVNNPETSMMSKHVTQYLLKRRVW